MKKNVNMLQGRLAPSIIRFAVPVILTTLLQNLFNTADLIVVGQFCGSASVAAVTATTSITNLLVSLFTGLSLGAGLTVARAIGSRNEKNISDAVHTAVPTALLGGALLSIIGVIFSPQLLKLMGTPEDVLPLSSVYMRIYFAGIIFTVTYNFCAAILRANGDTKLPLYFLTIAGVINVSLNAFFVVVCKLDVAGVAIATTISQGVSASLVVLALIRRKDASRLALKKMRIYKRQLLEIVRIGLPAGIQTSLFSVSNVLITSSINSFGSAAIISGNGAAQNIESFISPIDVGFNQAASNFIAQNLGAHQFDRIKKVFRLCILQTGIFMFAVGALAYLFGTQLLSFYITDSPEAISAGLVRMTYVTFPYFMMGIMDNTTGALRGLGCSTTGMIITLIGACGLRIAWIYTIFQIPKCHTLACLYQSYPVSWVVTFAVEAALFFILVNRKKRAANAVHAQSKS